MGSNWLLEIHLKCKVASWWNISLKKVTFLDLTPCNLVKFTDISEEYTASIFRVEMQAKQVTKKGIRTKENALFLTCYLFNVFLDLEKGGNKFLWNVGELLSSTLHIEIYNHIYENLKSKIQICWRSLKMKLPVNNLDRATNHCPQMPYPDRRVLWFLKFRQKIKLG
jgi:hypothetical protein